MVGQTHSTLLAPGKHHSKLEQLHLQELVVILVKVDLVVMAETLVVVEIVEQVELV
jgi:hypothetical protein